MSRAGVWSRSVLRYRTPGTPPGRRRAKGLLAGAALVLGGLACGAAPAPAQVILNVERGLDVEPEGRHLSLALGADLRRGNEELVDVQASVVGGYRAPRHWIRLLAGGEVVRSDGDDVARSGTVHLRYNWIFGERWRTFHFYQVQSNRVLALDRRTLLGSGLRTVALDTGRHRLEVGAGLMYEEERLEEDDLLPGEDARTEVARATSLAVYRYAVREGTRLQAVTYYQPRPDLPEDYRLLQDLSLVVDLTERLALELTGEWRYDSRPPTGIETSDLALVTGLRLEYP